MFNVIDNIYPYLAILFLPINIFEIEITRKHMQEMKKLQKM